MAANGSLRPRGGHLDGLSRQFLDGDAQGERCQDQLFHGGDRDGDQNGACHGQDGTGWSTVTHLSNGDIWTDTICPSCHELGDAALLATAALGVLDGGDVSWEESGLPVGRAVRLIRGQGGAQKGTRGLRPPALIWCFPPEPLPRDEELGAARECPET